MSYFENRDVTATDICPTFAGFQKKTTDSPKTINKKTEDFQ